MPGRALAQPGQAGGAVGQGHALGDEGLGRRQPGQLGGERRGAVELGQREAAGRQVQPGQPVALRAGMHGRQQLVAALLQERLVGDRARGDDAHHLALDQALAGGRIADLLADRHRLAQADQPRQVVLGGVHGHAGHRDRRTGAGAALGQGDVEQARRLAGVVVEQLVEVAHPEEQQDVRMLALGRQVLAHQRRVLVQLGIGDGHGMVGRGEAALQWRGPPLYRDRR